MFVPFKKKNLRKIFLSGNIQKTNITFSPDETDEFYFGFDEAFDLPKEDIYRMVLAIERFPPNKILQSIPVTVFDHVPRSVFRRLPDFKFNLFVQYKRPEYMVRLHASEWKEWQCPYYRYTVPDEQHKRLEQLRSKSNDRASVVYASPALHTKESLFQLGRERRIVENSNVIESKYFGKHRKYTYVDASNIGKLHSVAQDIEGKSLDNIIESHQGNEGNAFDEEVRSLSDNIEGLLAEDQELRELHNAAWRANNYSQLTEGRLSYAIANIRVISEILESRIYIMG